MKNLKLRAALAVTLTLSSAAFGAAAPADDGGVYEGKSAEATTAQAIHLAGEIADQMADPLRLDRQPAGNRFARLPHWVFYQAAQLLTPQDIMKLAQLCYRFFYIRTTLLRETIPNMPHFHDRVLYSLTKFPALEILGRDHVFVTLYDAAHREYDGHNEAFAAIANDVHHNPTTDILQRLNAANLDVRRLANESSHALFGNPTPWLHHEAWCTNPAHIVAWIHAIRNTLPREHDQLALLRTKDCRGRSARDIAVCSLVNASAFTNRADIEGAKTVLKALLRAEYPHTYQLHYLRYAAPPIINKVTIGIVIMIVIAIECMRSDSSGLSPLTTLGLTILACILGSFLNDIAACTDRF